MTSPAERQVISAKQARGLILILGILTAFGPMSIDMYLPSLPAMAADLGAPVSGVQMTLSSFFIGMGLGQMFFGPLSDRFGRRPLLLVGIALYVVTSAFCALAGGIEMLIGLRLLQALGGSAASVIARAMVRDFFTGDEAARVMSLIMLVMGAAPLLAPIVGGYVLLWFAVLPADPDICPGKPSVRPARQTWLGGHARGLWPGFMPSQRHGLFTRQRHGL